MNISGAEPSAAEPAPTAEPAAAVLDELQDLLAQVTGRAELAGLAPETALFGAGVGLDSLTGTLLLTRVRDRFGVDVAAEDLNLDALATLGTLAAFVAGQAGR
jgi:acyl carrier protein